MGPIKYSWAQNQTKVAQVERLLKEKFIDRAPTEEEIKEKYVAMAGVLLDDKKEMVKETIQSGVLLDEDGNIVRDEKGKPVGTHKRGKQVKFKVG